MKINQDSSIQGTWKTLNSSIKEAEKSREKLSAGQRITRAAMDAAGLAISEKMRSQISNIHTAARNIQDGISAVQTAEGQMGNTQNALGRMQELALQASNGVLTDQDRAALNVEFQELKQHINKTSEESSFNGQRTLDGSFNKGISLGDKGSINIHISDMSLNGLNINALSIDTEANAGAAMEAVKNASEKVSSQRADLGALQNRFEHTVENLSTEEINTVAAESRIRDLDMANEVMKLTKNQILMDTGSAVMAQANSKAASVNRLLG
ncbi:MAG: flagellin [Clostridia bacterium]|nr:flagellin [Clostridia bacterium]